MARREPLRRGGSVTAVVTDYLRRNGPATVLVIAGATGVKPATVKAALRRDRGALFAVTGDQRLPGSAGRPQALWALIDGRSGDLPG